MPDDDLNSSFNSSRRVITRALSLASSPIEISIEDNEVSFREINPDCVPKSPGGIQEFRFHVDIIHSVSTRTLV